MTWNSPSEIIRLRDLNNKSSYFAEKLVRVAETSRLVCEENTESTRYYSYRGKLPDLVMFAVRGTYEQEAPSPRSFCSNKKLPGLKRSLAVVIDFAAASFVNDFHSETALRSVICGLVTYCLLTF
jgi:hypothetical protein